MRFLWVDLGNNPDYSLGSRFGIDGWFFDPRDERVDRPYLAEVAKHGATGIYFGAAWGELGSTPESYVQKGSEWLERVRVGNERPRTQWDLEMHEPDFILRVVQLWRQRYPWHATSWTLEPHQGGWMSPAFVQAMLSARIRISPQLFGGEAMVPFDVEYVKDDLLARGWPASSISLCHDAALVHGGWKGYAFTQGRLPRHDEILEVLDR